MWAGEFCVCFVELWAVQAHRDGAVGASLTLWLEQSPSRPCLCPSWGFLRILGAGFESMKLTQATFLILPGQELNGALCISKEQRCTLQSTKQKNNPAQQHNSTFKKKSKNCHFQRQARSSSWGCSPGGSRRNEGVGSWAWREKQWGLNNSVPWESGAGDLVWWCQNLTQPWAWPGILDKFLVRLCCLEWGFCSRDHDGEEELGRNCPHPAPLVLQDGRSHHQRWVGWTCSLPGEMQLLLLYTRLDLFTSMSRRVALQAIQPCLSLRGSKLELSQTWHAKYI